MIETEKVDWFRWKGEYSDGFGTVVENMTVSARPERKVVRVAVAGRDGDLTVGDDTYSTTTLILTCRWPSDMSFERVNAWLSGKGDLILSSKPDRRYKADMAGAINYQNLGAFWRADVYATAQPFDYEAEPEVIALPSSQSIYNPGTRWSLPKITVYGTGTLIIGGYTLVITETDGENHVTIDSEIGECYYTAPDGSLIYRGDKVTVTDPNGKASFPVLQPGEIDVEIGEGIVEVHIQGNWRWF